MEDLPDSGDIPRENFAVGLKQSERLLKKGCVSKVFLAYDASLQIADKINALCKEKGIVPDTSNSMAVLGKLCGIEVGCAVCVLK